MQKQQRFFSDPIIKSGSISVVIVGMSHRDFGAIALINDMIKKLHALGESVAFCGEQPSDLSLEETLKQVENNVSLVSMLLNEKKGFAELAKRDDQHANVYFNADQSAEIIEFMRSQKRIVEATSNKKFTQLTEPQMRMQADTLINCHSQEEWRRLYTMLKETKTPAHFMDLPKGEHDSLFVDKDSAIMDLELDRRRVAHMVNTLNTKVLPDMVVSGGVVIIETGLLHMKRLACNLLYSNSQLDKPLDLKVFPMHCFSNYTQDTTQSLRYEGERRYLQDSDSVCAMKSNFTVVSAQMIEDKKSRTFSCKEFQTTFNKALWFSQQPKLYFIPHSTNQDQASAALMELNAVVSRQNNQGKYVLISSHLLTKDMRGLLGIDRRLVTIDSDSVKRVELLQQDDTITLEPTVSSNKILVTFPEEKLVFVDRIVNQWGKYQSKLN